MRPLPPPSSSSPSPSPPLISSSPQPQPPPRPTETPATLPDLQNVTNTLADRLERQLLHIKDRSFNRVHRKIDAILNKIAAKEDVFREFGAVKRAVAAVERGRPPPQQARTDEFEIEEVKKELQSVREDVACVRREVMAVRAITVNQWVRGLPGLIVRVPPLVGGCGDGGGGGGAEDDFPATVRDFWKLGGIDKRDALARLAECYAIHNNGWQDCRWGRRVERSDDHHAGGAAQFVTLRDDDDAVPDDYPMRCLRALATVWGLAFDLLERPPPDLVIVVVETGAMVTAENDEISHG